MTNEKSKKNKIILKSIIIITTIIIYIMYVYYYHKNLYLESFIEHTVNSLNLFGNYLVNIIDKLISNESLLKTLTISGTIIFLLRNIDIQDVFNDITALEIFSLKLAKDKARDKAEEIKKETNKKTSDYINNEQLDKDKKRKEIIELLIDNNNIIYLIELYINGSRNIKIPINRIPRLYKIENIGKIFEYKRQTSSIKIIGFKKDIEDVLIDVYNELKEENIIYSEC